MTDGKDDLPVIFGKDPAMFDVAKRDRDEIESGHEFMIYDLRFMIYDHDKKGGIAINLKS